MTKLEKIAEAMFDRYCIEETGHTGNWAYLSPHRQAAWVEEAYMAVELVVKSMQETVKPLPAPHKFDTVWEQGRFAGQSNERTTFIGYLHDTLQLAKRDRDEFLKNKHNGE